MFSNFELDLEMNDLLDEFGEDYEEDEDPFDIDIFAERPQCSNVLSGEENCGEVDCKMKTKGGKHDYAMDSTIISFQYYQDQDCSAEQVMFDRTCDDVSLF